MAKRIREPGLTFNMTPMIDIVFLLIVFFMLVSQFASQEILPMELPEPHRSIFDEKIKPEHRAVVQVVFADTQDETSEVHYYIGGARFDDLETLTQRLADRIERNPAFVVVIRADRRVEYAKVRDLMACVAKAKVPNMFLTAQVNLTRGQEEQQ